MKQSRPLKRGKPLTSTTPLTSTAGLQRARGLTRTPWRPDPTMCACGKTGYLTEQDAAAAMTGHALRRYSSPHRSRRDQQPGTGSTYRCEHGMWHYTRGHGDEYRRLTKRLAAARPRDTGPAGKVRRMVYLRDEYRCAVCGTPLADRGDRTVQHRVRRGDGGSSDPRVNGPANLLTCCWYCNVVLIEGSNPRACAFGWAIRRGDLGPRGFDAIPTMPVLHAVHGWVLLDREGGWETCPAPPHCQTA